MPVSVEEAKDDGRGPTSFSRSTAGVGGGGRRPVSQAGGQGRMMSVEEGRGRCHMLVLGMGSWRSVT
jgi:hypothetical protein